MTSEYAVRNKKWSQKVASLGKYAVKKCRHMNKRGVLGDFPLTGGTCITKCVSGKFPWEFKFEEWPENREVQLREEREWGMIRKVW